MGLSARPRARTAGSWGGGWRRAIARETGKRFFEFVFLGSNSNESFDGNKSLDVVDGK